MKKLLIVMIMMVIGNTLMAQKATFGIKMGANVPSLQPNTSYSPNSSDKLSIKFLLGAFTDIKLVNSLSLQTGINFSVKGNKSIEQQNSISFGSAVPYTTEKNINIYYLELPINLLYNKEIKWGSVYMGGGAYGAYAIGGRIRSIDKRNTYLKRGTAESISFGEETNQLKTSDFGLNVLAGLRLKGGVDFSVGYGFGLTNISNNSAFKSQNRVGNVAVGYVF